MFKTPLNHLHPVTTLEHSNDHQTAKPQGNQTAKWIFTAILFSTLIWLAGLLTGCGQQVSTSQDEGYFPHGDGYSWTYIVISTTEIAGVDPYTTTTEETYYFDGTTIITNEIVAQNYCKQGSPYKVYYLINDTGVYRFGDSLFPTTEAKIILSYPLNIGKKWEGLTGNTVEVTAYETVSVPLGTFYAYKISHDWGLNDEYYEWYPNNIGEIKEYTKLNTMMTDPGDETRVIPATYETTRVLKSKNF